MRLDAESLAAAMEGPCAEEARRRWELAVEAASWLLERAGRPLGKKAARKAAVRFSTLSATAFGLNRICEEQGLAPFAPGLEPDRPGMEEELLHAWGELMGALLARAACAIRI